MTGCSVDFKVRRRIRPTEIQSWRALIRCQGKTDLAEILCQCQAMFGTIMQTWSRLGCLDCMQLPARLALNAKGSMDHSANDSLRGPHEIGALVQINAIFIRFHPSVTSIRAEWPASPRLARFPIVFHMHSPSHCARAPPQKSAPPLSCPSNSHSLGRRSLLLALLALSGLSSRSRSLFGLPG